MALPKQVQALADEAERLQNQIAGIAPAETEQPPTEEAVEPENQPEATQDIAPVWLLAGFPVQNTSSVGGCFVSAGCHPGNLVLQWLGGASASAEPVSAMPRSLSPLQYCGSLRIPTRRYMLLL